MLLPVAGAPASEYYDLGTGRPRAKYVWYFSGLHNLARLAEDITTRGDEVIAEMRRQDGVDESRWVAVTGVRAELTLRHLVPPDAYRKHLPSGARAITLHDQDLDSTSARLVRENPELLDFGVAVLSIVKTDSFTVQGRAYSGAYAIWWLYALDTTSAPKRILVPLNEWYVESLASGPMRAAGRPAPIADINVESPTAGTWTVSLSAKDLQIRGSCAQGTWLSPHATDLSLGSDAQRYLQEGGDRTRCTATWDVTGTHQLAATLRAASGAPAALYQSTSFGRGWRARITGEPGK